MAASLVHEALVELFQRNPRLAPLLAAARGVLVPPHDEVLVHPGELTELVPVGFRADAVALLRAGGRVVHALVLEVQLGPDDGKRYSWPLYQAASRARHRCPTTLCVLALDPTVARWCAEPIATGQPGAPFVPLVLGAEAVPRVREPAADPHLAALSALAHGNGPGGPEVVLAALGAVARLGGDEGAMLEQIIWASLGEAARRALEATMDYEKVKAISPFYREGEAKGEAKGRAEGKAEGLRVAVADLCEVFGLELGPERRAQLASMNAAELEALRAALKQHRRWP